MITILAQSFDNHLFNRVAEGKLEGGIIGKVSIGLISTKKIIAENIRLFVVARVSFLKLLVVELEIAIDHFLRLGFGLNPGWNVREMLSAICTARIVLPTLVSAKRMQFLLVPELAEKHPEWAVGSLLYQPFAVLTSSSPTGIAALSR